MAALYQDELYEMVTARAGVARLQQFGVIFGYNRVVIYVEPVRTTATRSSPTRPVRTCSWTASRCPGPTGPPSSGLILPDEIKNLMDEVTKDSTSTDHREAIRERLKQIRDLMKVSRYRRTPSGTATIDEPTVGGKPRESDTTGEGRNARSGGRGGRAGDIYALFALAEGEPGEEVISEFDPKVDWVSLENGKRIPPDLEDRAAKYLVEENLLLINADFRVFRDMVDRWIKRYESAAVTSGVQPVVEDAVREWFEQALIESVVGVQSLRGSQEWSVEDIAKALNQEALTTAVMQRYHVDNSIAPGARLQARLPEGPRGGVAMAAPLRMLSLSSRTHDDRIHRASYGSSASMLDYDVVLWEPEQVLAEYLNHYYTTTYQGLHSFDEDGSFELLRAASRRRAEMTKFLELGRTLVIVVPADLSWFIDTGQRTTSGTGRNQKITRHVRSMNIAELLPVQLQVSAAQGDEMELKLGEPFAGFWRSQRDRLYYSAVITAQPGTVAATVERTDMPVAAIVREGNGTVVLIPTVWWPDVRRDDVEDEEDGSITRSERRAMDEALTDALLQLVTELRAQSGEYSLPKWAAAVHLPAEPEQRADLRQLQERLAKTQEAVDARRAAIGRLEERKLLFTGTGVALEHIVEEALQALGFDVEAGEPGRTDRHLSLGERRAVIEIKGKSKSAAEKDSAQLEKWVAGYHAEHEVQPKGFLLVNGWRELPLDERESKAVFPDQMLEYAAGRKHCLMTGLQLLCAWLDAEAHPDRAVEIAENVMNTEGVYEGYAEWRDYLGAAIEDQSDGS